MIFQTLIIVFLPFISFIILILHKLLSNAPAIPFDKLSGMKYFLSVANALLPEGFLFMLLTSIAFWTFVSFSWAVVEFIYKKLPFLNIR